ncbi:polymorphic outer membrane protein E family [Chlamydia felis Fe/C-56]|uniref:Polymorphic outer membrane protein E family n=4 Tax=Chlamydia felis TaxID=83556 RepID=Q253N0_CHLFF|nr:polymorphic outer membrane protein E family [Chlamydia felis Fe/C-56]
MYPYTYPFLCLISLSIFSQKLDCLAKEKEACSCHEITGTGLIWPRSNPYGIDQVLKRPTISVGNLHNQNSDIDITDKKYFCVNYQYYRGNGGAITARTLNITKNIGPIIFRENITNDNGGAIFSPNCNITYNKQECCFINNMANVMIETSDSRSGGAIKCSQLVISNNIGCCQFLNNTASLSGGAIAADNDINIANNYGAIVLGNNKCFKEKGQGGSIYSANCSITSNYAPINFINNQAGCAGAVYVTGTCKISHNSEIIKFLNNSSLNQTNDPPIRWNPGGGAIYCTSCSITNNPKGLIFQSNSSKRNAGAIYAQNLTIKDNGPILFINNSSTWGAAIQNYNGGRFYLSADSGDIVFKRNLSFKSSGSYRNALHSTANLNLQIGARQGHSVKFYDPIENEHPSPEILIFNPENHHLGTVLFSGADVSPNNTNLESLRSKMRNTSKIAHGVLAVEDSAVLAIYKITQDEGTLRLGNGAVITTTQSAGQPTTVGCTLAFTKLALNLPSILAKGAQAPKIWIYPSENGNRYTEDPNPTITLSGNLSLLNDDNEDPYDSLNLSRSISRIPFLYLCDTTTKKITVDDLNIEAINDQQHYGHQGVWSPYWEEYTTTTNPTSALTANTSHRILYADWTPTGYIPNPEYRGDLVANVLWQAAYNAISGLHNLTTPPPRASRIGIAGGGSGAYVSQKTRNLKPGFELFSRGYSTQASSPIKKTNHNFALSFSQFYSEIKESESKSKVSSNCYFAGAQLQIPWLNENILSSASLGYAYSHNCVKTKNQNTNTLSQGYFQGHTLGSELCCMLPESKISNLQFRPFIKALGIHAIQENFTETGMHIRSFQTKDPLINVTLPVGIYCYTEHVVNLKTIWEMQLAYSPTIYRQKPKITTTRLISKGTWITSGTPVDHHAVSILIKNTTTLLNTMSLSINYRGDFSKSTLCNFLNVTSEIKF